MLSDFFNSYLIIVCNSFHILTLPIFCLHLKLTKIYLFKACTPNMLSDRHLGKVMPFPKVGLKMCFSGHSLSYLISTGAEVY